MASGRWTSHSKHSTLWLISLIPILSGVLYDINNLRKKTLKKTAKIDLYSHG